MPGFPTFISSSTAVIASGTTLTINAPASISAGNLLVALVCFPAAGNPTISMSGWTQAAVHSGACTSYVFTKVATGSEPSTYNITLSSGGASTTAMILQYANSPGCDVTPNMTNFTSGTGFVTPSLTPTAATDELIMWWTNNNTGVTWTPPTTSLGVPANIVPAFSGAAGTASAIAYAQDWGSLSATGSNTATSSVGGGGIAGAVLLSYAPASTVSATLSLGPLSLTALSTLTGTATLPLGALTFTASGIPVTPNAPATLNLGPLTLTANGSVFGATLLLGPLTLTSTSINVPVPIITLGPLTLTTTTGSSSGSGSLAFLRSTPIG